MSIKPTALITGIRGFTGHYMQQELQLQGYTVFGLINHGEPTTNERVADITNIAELKKVFIELKPDYIIHLAAIAFVPFSDEHELYNINLFGTLHILEAIASTPNYSPKKILLASSANVYGNPDKEIIDETTCPHPVNHYGNSKLAMENMARNYFSHLPIIITRPFNYTGIGQNENFLIPKIIKHYVEKKPTISLGNLSVVRDFSAVIFVVSCYRQLLESVHHSKIVNICSGTGTALKTILTIMNQLADYQIIVETSAELSRNNEIKQLIGSNKKLFNLIGEQPIIPIHDLLTSYYKNLDV